MNALRITLHTLLTLAVSAPLIASAQTTLATYIVMLGNFLSSYVVPLIIGVATLMFLYGVGKAFIIDTASKEGKKEGKMIALWGILALVFVISLWGLVTLVVSGLGIGGMRPVCPDYYPNCGA